MGDPVNIRCFVAHHATIVGTDVVPANVITPQMRMSGILSAATVGTGDKCHADNNCSEHT
ncbi:MAG: hypothetical protein ACLPN1_00285 [Dissulfurispiraceae bacterium]